MKNTAVNNSILMQKAVLGSNLIGRLSANQRYASKDFNSWSKELVDKIKFGSVLDLCCGTGNQLVLYARKAGVRKIVGVDLSREALGVAKNRLQEINPTAEISLKKNSMEKIFSAPGIKDNGFDLISCFYGLYYSRDVNKTLEEMIDHVPNGGHILIVGPHGANNSNLFGLLEKHFKLPDLVKSSSSTFMEQEVVPVLKRQFSVKTEYFLNRIRYPDAKSLFEYWRASTFFSPSHEDAVLNDIKLYFNKKRGFIVEKHVMALTAKKGRSK
jgi:ubiquinone/menaquinone biosynthesis C-methylase UbiE